MGYLLHTDRLTVRLMRSTDIETQCAYRNDPEVAELQDWELPYTPERAAWLTTQDALDDLEPTGWTELAIDLDGTHIGEIPVGRDESGQQASVGFSLARAHWGRGYAQEAARAVVEDLVERLGVVRVTGEADPRNIASQRALEAIGLVHEHEGKQSYLWRGAWTDTTYYASTADDWRAWRDRPTGPPAEVTIEPVDSHNVWDWRRLETHWTQRRFVAPMDISYADALRPDIWLGGRLVPVLRGIRADGEPAGFLMYADRSPTMAVPYLWRMLIDRRFQGRGIGRRALALLAEDLLAQGNSRLWSSFTEGAGGPRDFYLGLGARLTGEIIDDETAFEFDLADLADLASCGSGVTAAATPPHAVSASTHGLANTIDEAAERTGFSGVVRVDQAGERVVDTAYGLADRAHSIRNTMQTRFGIASGTKTFTAVTVLRLIERGILALDTPARSLLRDDLPLIDDAVTIGHLLAHRSGIGDYLDESAIDDMTSYVMTVPVHRLATTEDYLPALDGNPTQFAPGERGTYNNAGYVVLALLAERASGRAFPDLIEEEVCRPAGLTATAFERMDQLPGSAAIGYLERDGLRTNALHLPVHGSGDGGIYSTTADLARFWDELTAGNILGPGLLAEALRPHSDWPEESRRYGLGFHRHTSSERVWMEGYDAGVSMTSLHDPATQTTITVLGNWTDAAWPMVRLLTDWLDA